MTDSNSEFVWVRRQDLPDPDKLDLLADWFDAHDAEQVEVQRGKEVQQDLRRWAAYVRSLGGTNESESE